MGTGYHEFAYLKQGTKPKITISKEVFEKTSDVSRILEKVRRKEVVVASFVKNEEIGYSIGTLKKECEKLGSKIYALDNLLFIVPKEIPLRTG